MRKTPKYLTAGLVMSLMVLLGTCGAWAGTEDMESVAEPVLQEQESAGMPAAAAPESMAQTDWQAAAVQPVQTVAVPAEETVPAQADPVSVQEETAPVQPEKAPAESEDPVPADVAETAEPAPADDGVEEPQAVRPEDGAVVQETEAAGQETEPTGQICENAGQAGETAGQENEAAGQEAEAAGQEGAAVQAESLPELTAEAPEADSTAVLSSTGSVASGALANGTYYIAFAKNTDKVLDVAGGSTANSANVQIYGKNNSAAQQFALLYNPEGGYYTITNVKSGKALDIAGGSKADGANVQQYASNGSLAQQWILQEAAGGAYSLLSMLNHKALDIAGASDANGTNARMMTASSGASQLFRFLLIESGSSSGSGSSSSGGSGSSSSGGSGSIADGTYTIAAALDQSKVLDIAGGSTANSANVQIYASNNSDAQKYAIAYNAAGGYYTILNVKSEKAVDIAGASKADGANVQQYAANGSLAQQWILQKNSNGTCTILSRLNNKALDIANGSTANGTNVRMMTATGSAAQQWVLKLLEAAAGGESGGSEPGGGEGGEGGEGGGETPEPPVEEPLQAPPVNGTYYIKSNMNPKMVLDIAGGSTANGANVQIYTNNGSIAQQFELIWHETEGYYTILNLKSEKSLDVAGGSTANGANVQQYTSNHSGAQQWVLQQIRSGVYNLISRASGKVLDVAGGTAANGANVRLMAASSSAAQEWVFELIKEADENSLTDEVTYEPVPTMTYESGLPLEDGLYYIVSGLSENKVLDVSGASVYNGTNAQLYTKNNSAAQQFVVNYDSADQTYTILSSISGRALNVQFGSTANGANVNFGGITDSPQQKWTLKEVKGGLYSIISKLNSKALDVAGASTANGANVQMYTANESDAQLWRFLPVYTGPAVVDGVYIIESAADPAKAVSVQGSSMANGANVVLQTYTGANNQLFILTREDDNTYRINNYNSGKLLTENGSSNGANVTQQESTDSTSKVSAQIGSLVNREQRWILKDAGNGRYLIVNALSEKRLELANEKTADGTNVQVNAGNDSLAQKFYLIAQTVKAIEDGTYTLTSALAGEKNTVSISGESRYVNAHAALGTANEASNAQKWQIAAAGDGYYTITNVQSKHALAVTGGKTAGGMGIHQEISDGSLAQKWLIHKNSNGTYSFINAKTGKAINAPSDTSNTDLTQETYSTAKNRQFTLKATSGTDTQPVVTALAQSGTTDILLKNANKYESPTEYIIIVDRAKRKLNVYWGAKGDWTLLRSWTCTVGSSATPTTPGLQNIVAKSIMFESPSDEFNPNIGSVAIYASKFSSGRLIHSILYHIAYFTSPEEPGPVLEGRLGQAISNGCVRLATANAKWVYDTVPIETTVYVY